MSGPAAVETTSLTKVYRRSGGNRALDAVDLRVSQGEIFGLLGRNGAGKTTLVKILLDLVRPTAGTAALLGRPPRAPAARRPVGYLPEDHRFPSYRSASASMDYYARLSGVPARERRRRTEELLDFVELEGVAHRKVKTYSKGMKQRLGLAQALVHEPQVLFLDEPTDGVDPVGRATIRDLLLRLREQGRTIFLNSHMLGEVELVCTRVGILEKGRLVSEGSIAELSAVKGAYRMVVSREPDAETLEELRGATGTLGQEGTSLDLTLERPEDVDAVVDLLRSRGLGIRELTPRRLSLEEIFLEVIRGGDGRGART